MSKMSFKNLIIELINLSPIYAFLYIGFFIYVNTFSNGWSFDDIPVIVTNPDITSLNEFLRDSYPGRPLRELTFLLDYMIFGENPTGWHIQNILWHSINAFLVFKICDLIVNKKYIAWIAALLFLVHPIHVEVVAQISHRKDSLALLFILLTIMSYVKFRKEKKWCLLICSVMFLIIGSYAKINVIMCIPMIVCYEYIYNRKTLVFYVSLIVIMYYVLFVGIDYVDQFVNRSRFLLLRNGYDGGYGLFSYIYVVMKSWIFIFLKLIWPYGLSVNYHVAVPGNIYDPWVIGSFFMLTVYVILLYITKDRWPNVCFFLLWIGVFYLPTSNIWPINWLAADRYLYAPSVGFFIVSAIIVNGIIINNKIKINAVALVCIVFSIMVVKQNRVWLNDDSLWANAYKYNKYSAIAIVNYANASDIDDGSKLKLYDVAMTMNKKYSHLYYSLGKYYDNKGNTRDALLNYRKFIIYHDTDFEVTNKLIFDKVIKRLRDSDCCNMKALPAAKKPLSNNHNT